MLLTRLLPLLRLSECRKAPAVQAPLHTGSIAIRLVIGQNETDSGGKRVLILALPRGPRQPRSTEATVRKFQFSGL